MHYFFILSPVALALAVAPSALGLEAKEFPVGAGGRLFGDIDVEQLLARPYEDFVPMACTGECLWAAHPEGWVFGNGTHYYLLTAHGVGFDLEAESMERSLTPMDGTAYPSHVALRGGTGDLRIGGAKWITSDDVLACQLRFTNATDKTAHVRVRLRLPSLDAVVANDEVAWSTKQHGLTILMRGRAPGFQAEPIETPKPTAIYLAEGESPVSQSGSTGRDHKAAASGGEVLGSNFGAKTGHCAEWRIEVKAPISDAALTIRYARADAGDAPFKLTIADGKVVERYGFQQTGGWGDSAGEFKVASFPLGAVPAGAQTVRVVAVADSSNVNFDALCIHPAGVAPFEELTKKGWTTLARTLEVRPQETKRVDVFVAAGTRADLVAKHLSRVATLEDPLKDHVAAYGRWLQENVPSFRCADEAFTRQYWHRATSILKKSLFRVGEGRLQDWAIAEGRWNSGWYPNMISYGAGHQIREARWLRDPQYVRGIISTWCANEKADGVFPAFIRPNSIGEGQYTDWITSTVWDAHCVAPDNERLKLWAGALKTNVDGWLRVYDNDGDGLLLVDSHWWTGMEWQPSFFFFRDFDKDRQDQQLERVDLTAYVYGSAMNLSRILRVLGDTEGEQRYAGIAAKIKGAVESVMWDDETRYFYSVEPKHHEKAMVKEVIGVYPFYFSMFGADSKYVGAWSSILDRDEFYTKFPVASASKKCPAYSQDIRFHGKDVGGCMWNGPTWPHANSLVLSAMAAALRENKNPPMTTSNFFNLLQWFTMAQFRDQSLEFPWTGEYYNGDTGQWRTDERDYNHSTYLDIIIADMAGLRPRNDDTLEVHPLIAPECPSFVLDGVRYRGHNICIAWQRPNDMNPSPDGLPGFRVYVDGRLLHHSSDAHLFTAPNAVPAR
ncbi:MAG: hypothetical protein HZB26_10030 [Candidatus Hydrogenedentes bacterium]|nr:hypothetical protein [Candidatus Hydrogenedentota bacterium]